MAIADHLFVDCWSVNYNLVWSIISVFSLMVMIYSLVYRGLIETTESLDENGEEIPMSMWARAKGIMVRPSFVILLISSILFFVQ